MVYDRINIMLPTYGRAKTKLPKFIESIFDTVDDLKNVCISFVVNASDTETREAIHGLCGKKIEFEILEEDSKECDLSSYFNLSYRTSRFNGENICVSMFGDDMVFLTKKWDSAILEKINDIYGFGFVYGDDDNSQHEELCVYFVTTRTFVEFTEKPFMCSLFAVDYMDNVWMEIGRKLNCAAYLPNLHVLHDHATRSGNTPDDVWLRMRKQYDLSHDCMIAIDGYAEEIAGNVRKNLSARYLTKDISYCMTTYDRVALFRQTVSSWNRSVLLPQRLYVFDDGSKEIDKIEREIGRMKNAYLVPAEKHYGCDKRNAHALTYFDTPAVMMIDSDTSFAPWWCIAATTAWEAIRDRENIAGVTLFNTECHERIEDVEKEDMIPGLNLKATVGGFGTIFKKTTIASAFTKADIDDFPNIWSWDNFVNDLVKKQDKRYCGTCKSYLQHTGFTEGTHVTDAAGMDYAPDFVGELANPAPARIAPVNAGCDVLFAAMARMGDIIAASMIANQLIDKGLKLTWLVILRYENLVRRICPQAKVIAVEPVVEGPDGFWSEMTTQQMKNRFPNFPVYINAQIGARENHNYYMMSGLHPCLWIKNHCGGILGIDLDNEFKKYLRFNDAGIRLTTRDAVIPENLAIIASEAKTSQAFDEKTVKHLYDDLLNQKYNPRILIEKRPQRISIKDIREKYLFGLSIEQCILLLRKAKRFVGQDSGLSWCSLYSDCIKTIYHRRSRIDKTNTFFGAIDEKAEDIVIEDR